MTTAILFGDKPGAILALKHMHSLKWKIPAVVSAMTERDFIGGPSLQQTANQLNIPFITQEDYLENFPQEPDLIISYMYRKRVKEETLKRAKIAAVNFHAAPLPRFGGWAYYNVAILEELDNYGVTCHHMDEGFDTGDLCMQRFFDIDPATETAISLEQKAQGEMLMLFSDFCKAIISGKNLPRVPQKKKDMRYMKKAEFDALKEVPTNADTHTIQKYARAFWYPPFGLAYIKTNNGKAEIIPEIVKSQLAKYLHQDDYLDLEKKISRS